MSKHCFSKGILAKFSPEIFVGIDGAHDLFKMIIKVKFIIETHIQSTVL